MSELFEIFMTKEETFALRWVLHARADDDFHPAFQCVIIKEKILMATDAFRIHRFEPFDPRSPISLKGSYLVRAIIARSAIIQPYDGQLPLTGEQLQEVFDTRLRRPAHHEKPGDDLFLARLNAQYLSDATRGFHVADITFDRRQAYLELLTDNHYSAKYRYSAIIMGIRDESSSQSGSFKDVEDERKDNATPKR